MMPRSEVYLGDALRAIEALRTSLLSADEILRALGLERVGVTTNVTEDEQSSRLRNQDRDVQEGGRGGPGFDTLRDEAAAQHMSPSPEPNLVRPPVIGRMGHPSEPVVPEIVEPELTEHFARPSMLEPLLRPNWTFGIVQSATSTLTPTGAVDVAALVGDIARLRPVGHLPRVARESMYRGIQLLVDVGDSMQPFFRDQREFASKIVDVVGAQRVEQLRFRGCPWSEEGAGPSSVRTWKPYRPPDPATPVVVLSDLGVSGPPDRPRTDFLTDWVALARSLAQRGSRVMAFVPVDVDRYPTSIRSQLSLIQWDRRTSLSTVRQIVRQSRR